MIRHLLILIALGAATPAMASDLIAKPAPNQSQHIRYEHGLPTIDDDMPVAAVSVMPAPTLDHGSLHFKVAVFNKSAAPVNLGIENMTVEYRDVRLPPQTKDELAHAAKKRAMWSQIGMAMLAGVAAGVQNNNTVVTTSTPHGLYRTVIQRPGLSDGQLATVAAGGGAIALSQIGLQRTLANLDDEIIQTTTIDGQTGYGGRIVAHKLKDAKPGDTVTLLVDVGGELHRFAFVLTKG